MPNILKIIRISKPLYHLVLIIAFLIVVSAAMDLVSPIIFKFIVDEIVKGVQHQGGSVNKIAWLIALSFGVNIISLILTTLSERLGDHFAGRLRKYLTEKFYYKILTLPQSYFDSEISGKIVNQLSRGIVTIQDFVNDATNFILPMVLQSLFTIIVMAYYNIPIAIFTFLLFPSYMILSYYSTKKWGEREVEKNKIEDISRGRIQEVIANMSLVKSFNNEKKEYEFLSSSLTESNKIYAVQSTTYHFFDFARGFSLNIILLLISIITFFDTFKGTLSIGTMVLILQLVNQARRPLFAMSFILTQVQRAESGSKEFFEVLELPSKEYFDKNKVMQQVKDAMIVFSHVFFHYKDSDKVLHDVSFTLHKNQTVALVGHSGAGKTTIVNLILKFYDSSQGDIYLNGMNYKELDHTFIRDNIALVFQENELFSTTVRENVSYGMSATDKEIINALKLANAYDFVKKLPKGIDSEIGERGVKLSGGQKQRIQIARAILKNSPILILDEATSSLDAKSEREVQDALENLMKDKLVLIIAHRFSTIQNADTILVIDNGKIVDSGNPKELSKKPGIYSNLLRYQIEGNKKLLESFELY